MSLSVLSSIFVTAIGFLYTITTFTLPAAAMGHPNEPKIFPALLGISLLILGVVLVIQEIKKLSNNTDKKEEMKFGRCEKQIALTVANGFVYALLFNPIGYVFSTIIFLIAELFVFSGFKTWKKSLLVAVVFSAIAYAIFDVLLGIYLPKSFLGIF